MTDRIEIKSNISNNSYERLILDFSHKKFGFFNTFPKRSVSSIYFDTDNLKDYFDHVIGNGKRKVGRQPLRWKDGIEEDMKFCKVTPELAQDRDAWRKLTCMGDPR